MNFRAAHERDKGILCKTALVFGEAWDFIDRRQIDAYAISIGVLWGSVQVMEWAMGFAERFPDKALSIAAVTAPYMALQAAAIKFLFDARSSSFVESKRVFESTTETKSLKTESTDK